MDKVQHNFSKHARSYDTFAACQNAMARELVDTTRLHLHITPDTILDLGTGTGFVSAQLFNAFPDAHIYGLDISPEMLQRAGQNPMITDHHFEPICADLRTVVIPPNTQLCISGFTFQWIDNLNALWERLAHQLPEHATLAFSTLCSGTFPTLHRAFQSINHPYPGPKLKSFEEIRETLQNYFTIRDEKQIAFPVNFDTPTQFLKTIQGTGAMNAGTPISVQTLRSVLQFYHTQETSPIQENYQVAIFVATSHH